MTKGRESLGTWRSKRLLLALLLGPPFVAVLGLFVLKVAVEAEAARAARSYLEEQRPASESVDDLVERMTALVHRSYAQPAQRGSLPLLMRARPYLTHRFVPTPLRLRVGAIDTIYLKGLCDNAARTLGFVLEQAGLTADQLNMVTPTAAHSVVLAETSDGRKLLADPLYAVIPRWEGRILGPAEAQSLMREGISYDRIWRPLTYSAKTGFYRRFADAVFARQGEPLQIRGDVDLTEGEALQLGEPDGSSDDVVRAAIKAELTPYWHYVGSRYDRAWMRRLRFHQDTRVTLALTQPPKAKFITSERTPEVRGKELIFEVHAGETLRFVDGAAGYDWLRLRSYQDVDYVRFEAIR